MLADIIPLNSNHRNIAIRLSGGPDSAIIYYALCNFYKDDSTANIYPMTVATPLRPHSIRKSKDVINIVARLTGRMPTHHYTVFHDAHNSDNTQANNSREYSKSQEDLESYVFKTANIDARYAGLSVNCPADDMLAMVNQLDNKSACQLSLEYRDTSRDVPVADTVTGLYDITMYLPFAKHDKRVIFELYSHYNLLDTLYPYTWSCENDMQAQSDNPVHCGTCYFCLERIFAFGKL